MLEPVLHAVQFNGRAVGGASGVCFFETSDGREWAVKPRGNRQGDSILWAELVCHRLGRCLTAPVLEAAVVDIPPVLAVAAQVRPGLAFGVRRVDLMPGVPATSVVAALKAAKNARDCGAILVLDHWTLNGDRATNGGNIMFEKLTRGWRVLCLDQGHAFGGPPHEPRRIQELTSTTLPGGEFHEALRLAATPQGVEAFIERLERVGIDAGLFSGIPSDWGCTYHHRSVLEPFLVIRKDMIRVHFRACGWVC